MVAPAFERPTTLAEVAEQLEVPDGFRVEVVGGEIIVSPPTPSLEHATIASRLHRALDVVTPAGHLVFQVVTVEIERTGERYVPDGLVLSDSVARGDGWTGADWIRPAAATTLVAEITSPNNAETDRVRKLRGYAVGQVPLYLLIETAERTVTLFSDPHEGLYQAHTQVGFGAQLSLPKPFEASLDTSAFG